MALVKNGELFESSFTDVSSAAEITASGPVIVSLEQWRAQRETLLARGTPLGIRLRSDQPPELIAADLAHFAVVALEFPKFRDGRAYSYARLLRERYGYKGELRAVGEVLTDQLFYMLRCGFDSFQLADGKDVKAALEAFHTFSVTYQGATDDGRPLYRRASRGG